MKKWIYGISICSLSMIMFTGCGNDSPIPQGSSSPILSEDSSETSSETPLSEAEHSILDYETKFASGEFTIEDYYALSTLYQQQGMIRKQRDLLEKCYRLYGDEQSFSILQELTVNLAEESDAIQKEILLMLQNLDTPGYFAESIHQIEAPEWMALLMPKMKEGVRNYYLEKDGQIRLVLRIGYDEEGKAFSTLWHHGEENAVTLLKYHNGMVQNMSTALNEGIYEGPFTLWILDSITGSIVKEVGTFVKGLYSGEYTLAMYKGNASGDPYDLWNNRENMKYSTYTAKADQQGIGELEQFALKLETYPAFTTYAVVPSNNTQTNSPEANDEAPKIRIFDGEIQWWNGQTWSYAGSAAQYEKEDPFYPYAQQWEEKRSALSDGLDLDNIAIPQPKPTPKPAQKPSVQKPSTSTPAPAPTPTPAPTPEPDPAPDYDDDDDDDDNNDDSHTPGPDDSTGSDDGSNDADVEWTPDIM